MIVTVTCNPAIDVTYTVDSLTANSVHRVKGVSERAGGKGVNVARVLRQLGERVVTTGFCNPEFVASMEDAGLSTSFVLATARVRRTVVVHSGNEATSFWEPGPDLDDPSAAADALEARVTALLADARALVVSGSLPPGVDPELPMRLAKRARAAGLPALLDLDDDALQCGAERSGAVLLPNRDELRRLVGAAHRFDVVSAARDVACRNGAPVVATLGSAGMVATSAEGTWHAALPAVLTGNPTGAGDAAAAAVARGLTLGLSWPDILVEAVALSAAAVVVPVAGEVDLPSYNRWRQTARVAPISSLEI